MKFSLVNGFTGALNALDECSFANTVGVHLQARTKKPPPPVYTIQQMHSDEIMTVSQPGPPASTWEIAPLGRADGIVLAGEGVIAVQTADCVPILAIHAERREVAALHAGWRGTAAGILLRLLERWTAGGDSAEAVFLAFGPSIRACCYDVREDCTTRFASADIEGAIEQREGRSYLELTQVLRNQARRFGIAADRIDVSTDCTRCTRGADGTFTYASFRREGVAGLPYGRRNASYIGWIDG